MARRTVVVVGAGIMGTATAWALSERDWDVTLLDAGRVPNPNGSSGGVHRLIRRTYGGERGYTAMVVEAERAWRHLWDVLGTTLWTRTGMLAVDTQAGTFGAETKRSLDALGLPYVLLDHDALAQRYPQFRIAAGATALLTEEAWFLRSRAIVGALVDHLRRTGVTVRGSTPVAGVDLDTGEVRLGNGATLHPDHVVVAAGPWTGSLLGDAAPALTLSRQVVLDLRAPDDLVATWQRSPAFLVQPAYGIPPRDDLPLKVGDHGFSLTGDPRDDRTPTTAEVEAVLEVVRAALVDVDRYELLAARTCFYTVADEERFQVGPAGTRGALLCGFSGHGFKFGPLIGQAVAAALDGKADWAQVTAWAAGRRVQDDSGPPGA